MSTKPKVDLIDTITAARAGGKSWKSVANQLNAGKLKTPSGKKWRGDYVAIWFKAVAKRAGEPVRAPDAVSPPPVGTLITRAILSSHILSDAEKIRALSATHKLS